MFRRTAIAWSMSLSLCSFAMGADGPQWLTDAHARENTALEPADIRSRDGWFKARAPGRLTGAIEKVADSYVLELDIGSGIGVRCAVFPGGANLANTLRGTLERTLESVESTQGKVAARALESTDSGSFGPVPYISLTWLYRVTGPEGPEVRALKQIVMRKGGAAIHCVHHDLGYKQTFAGIAQAIAESFETQEPAAAPLFVQISTATMSGAEIGVTVSQVAHDNTGDTQALQLTSIFLATADGKILAHDTTRVNRVRPDGTLIDSTSVEVSNGEVSENLRLARGDDATWKVEGEVQGKAVKTSLPKGSQPGNWIAQAQQLRKLLADPDPLGREHSIDLWISGNPERLTVVKTKVLARQGDMHFTARGNIGAIAANFTLEKASGMATTADATIGSTKFKLERIYASGGF